MHHMEVFHCEVDAAKKLPSWNGPCQSPSKPEILEPCKRVLAAWAMGALVSIRITLIKMQILCVFDTFYLKLVAANEKTRRGLN